VSEAFVTGLVVGGGVVGFLGYHVGQIRAARRAARNTYRGVRGIRR
jgi:hypothetical protein